jgi:uncharacterized NAD(P)/FAD-binding protein YdhS
VNRLTGQGRRRPLIAIVGGGASGTLTAVQLLRQAASQRLNLQLVLIDRYGRHGRGQAYSTGHEFHLLNTMAGQMSAVPDDPDHLVRWAGVPAEAFLPRRTYGRYLCETLEQAQRQALPSALLARSSSEITSIARTQAGRPLRLTGSDGWLEADAAVLALGPITAGPPFEAPASSRVIADPWRPGALDEVRDNKPVLIVGTGLTMIDLAMTIGDQSPGSAIYAVSRHGLLPRRHPGGPGTGRAGRTGRTPAPALAIPRGGARLRELMAHVSTAVAADPARWHDVVNSIRPQIPELWDGLPDDDKRLFLRRLARYWEVHRHPVPPATAARLAALRDTGRLSVISGRIADVADAAGQFQVRIDLSSGSQRGGGEAIRELTAGWIINAVGAATDIRTTSDPLLASLFASGIARPDPLGLGLDATRHGALINASGSASDVLYTLGPPLRGLWYETTSIPEIRDQAAALAARVTADLRLRRQRDSAA